MEVTPTPLPKLQLFATFATVLAVPIAVTSIYPFVNQFVRETGITKGDERKTGCYAGIILCLCLIQRPPPKDMIGIRVSVVGTPDLEPRPLIGGGLSNPAVRFPKSPGRIAFLRQHPYFLPCVVVRLPSFATWAIAYVWLKETAPVILAREKLKNRRNARGNEASGISGTALKESGMLPVDHMDDGTNHCQDDEPAETPQNSPTEHSNIAVATLMTRPLVIVYLNSTCMAFLDRATSSSSLSCIPLPSSLVASALIHSVSGSLWVPLGSVHCIVQFMYLGRIMCKLGPIKLYILFFMAFLTCFTAYPFTSHSAQRAGRVDGIVLVLMVVHLASCVGISMAHGAIRVLLVENVPPGGGLATANSICQMLSSGIRSTAPSFASSPFSVSLTKQLLGGHLVYYLLLAMTLMGMRLSYHLPGDRNRGRSRL